MINKDIKLIVLDMDGTTYHHAGTIIEANVEPIQQAMANGIQVAIVTGRPALAPVNQFIENGFGKYGNGVVVADNGGCIYDFKEKKVIEENTINSELAKKVFDLVQLPEFKGVEVWGYVNDLKTAILFPREQHSDGFKLESSSMFTGKYVDYESVKEKFDYKFFKLMAFNITDKFIEAVNKLGLETAVNPEGTNAEINAKGVNKKLAVEWLAKRDGLTADNIMAIGDSNNDLPMIEYAKYGASMENSIPAVKEVAKIHIPLTNEQGAVAYAINKYVLGK